MINNKLSDLISHTRSRCKSEGAMGHPVVMEPNALEMILDAAECQERHAVESEAQATLKRLAIIMAGSDSGGELAALTVTAQSLVDRCKTLAAAREGLCNTPLSKSACDVLKERHRQITVKGYSTDQDDTYIEGELAAAAISYIEPMEAENYWPAGWLDDSFKPSDYRRNLVKACALLFAEIERFDRQEARQ